jgi:hypothetical protein
MKFTENLDPRTEEGYRNAIELLASAKKQMNSELGRTVANLFGFDSDSALDSLYKKVDELHRSSTEKSAEKTTEGETAPASKCVDEQIKKCTTDQDKKRMYDTCQCHDTGVDPNDYVDDVVDQYIYDVLIEEYRDVTGERPSRKTVNDARKVLTAYTKWLFNEVLE